MAKIEADQMIDFNEVMDYEPSENLEFPDGISDDDLAVEQVWRAMVDENLELCYNDQKERYTEKYGLGMLAKEMVRRDLSLYILDQIRGGTL